LFTATILSSPGRYSGTWVIRASMRGKLFVALQLEVLHHFIKRITSGRARRVKHPSTFGATKTPKTLLYNPHQFSAHGLFVAARCLHLPIWMVCWASHIRRRLCEPRFRASFQSGELLSVGHVWCVLKRSVLLSIRVVSSLVLIGLREGVRHDRPDFLSRTPSRASSFPA
jgi:hypothetical protein